MDLRLLRYFITVAEERHVGRAADRLNMTQPPLSRAIRRLEDEFGTQLLERTPKGVELTPTGAILYQEATSLLEQTDRLQRRVTAAAGTAVIAVGTLADAAEQVGAAPVAAFRRRHPTRLAPSPVGRARGQSHRWRAGRPQLA
ncbi:LysR family transcriptional regulator [Mycobacterium eburneum]|nr:LysR family transcriptional regulator [Mycobacterium eburneum]TDH47999.1 LysR family transcriptional regulator [Mycobacterium eburneum]